MWGNRSETEGVFKEGVHTELKTPEWEDAGPLKRHKIVKGLIIYDFFNIIF